MPSGGIKKPAFSLMESATLPPRGCGPLDPKMALWEFCRGVGGIERVEGPVGPDDKRHKRCVVSGGLGF